MAVEKVSARDRRTTDLLKRARQAPLILQTEGSGDFVVLPLDDDVIDFLLERSPALIEECRRIRERMKEGQYLTHDQVLQALQDGE